MTAPREILPGRTWLLTRRCTQRQFLLRPDDKTNEIFAYCLGEAAKRCEIELIAWLVMSNHYHAVVHDPLGQLPRFLEHLHKMLAKTFNARWSRWENLWSTEETCVTHLATPADVFDKVLYVLANPVVGHLVDRVVHWPGLSSLGHLTNRTTSHPRPKVFFSPRTKMADTATLKVVQPPCSRLRETFDEWAASVRAALAILEEQHDVLRAREGVRVLGRKAILKTSAFDSPSTAKPKGGLRPVVACKNADQRVRVLEMLLEFRRAYATARRLFIEGLRDTLFPAGTYRLRAWGARCAPFPPPVY